MFCKCFFASIWDAVQQSAPLESKVRLHPLYLPAMGYLVESADGWVASAAERFQQARRHAQGVAELGFILLQYILLVRTTGIFQIPARTHARIAGLAWKMCTVHITNAVQAFALVLVMGITAVDVVLWLYGGGLYTLYNDLAALGFAGVIGSQSFNMIKWAMLGIYGPLPPIAVLTSTTIFVLLRDTLEGRYTRGAEENNSCPSSGKGAMGTTLVKLGWWKSFLLSQWISLDFTLLAEVSIVTYGLLPEVLAAWSLLRRGTQFEYIVAAKPS